MDDVYVAASNIAVSSRNKLIFTNHDVIAYSGTGIPRLGYTRQEFPGDIASGSVDDNQLAVGNRQIQIAIQEPGQLFSDEYLAPALHYIDIRFPAHQLLQLFA